jgi:hypothetical protein
MLPSNFFDAASVDLQEGKTLGDNELPEERRRISLLHWEFPDFRWHVTRPYSPRGHVVLRFTSYNPLILRAL